MTDQSFLKACAGYTARAIQRQREATPEPLRSPLPHERDLSTPAWWPVLERKMIWGLCKLHGQQHSVTIRDADDSKRLEGIAVYNRCKVCGITLKGVGTHCQMHMPRHGITHEQRLAKIKQ